MTMASRCGRAAWAVNRSNYVCQIRVCKINSLGMLPVRQCLSNLALR